MVCAFRVGRLPTASRALATSRRNQYAPVWEPDGLAANNNQTATRHIGGGGENRTRVRDVSTRDHRQFR